MAEPRGIQERIDWFLSHRPSGPGMCAQHSWHSLGGNNGNPPAWGASDANDVYSKVKASGRFWTGTPKRGSLIVWKYGEYGHAAICYNDAGTSICTTDPEGDSGGVGIEPIGYPSKWGANSTDRIYTDEYNGVRFPIGTAIEPGDVYLSKLKYGQEDSDSVKRLQAALNAHPLSGGEELPITGNYYNETDEEVRLCQQQHGYGNDPVGESYVGKGQADHLFAGTGCNIIDDVTPPPEPTEGVNVKMKKWYSGKPSGTLTIPSDNDWHKLDLKEPDLGITTDSSEHRLLYLRLELDSSRSATKNFQTKFVRANGDDTAYDSEDLSTVLNSYPYCNVHLEDGPGDGGTWYAKAEGGSSPVKITTRYAKVHVFYEG